MYSSVGRLLVTYLCRAEEVRLHLKYSLSLSLSLSSLCLARPSFLYVCISLIRISQDPTGYLNDLLQDIVVELSQVTASKLTADVFSASSVSHKLARDYFLFIGIVSFYKPDLLAQCKIYAP